MGRRIQKVLVANRGEIAVRVMRACRELDLPTVAVYSDADRDSLHVRYADEARGIGPAPATESYLRIEALLDAARETGADAVHPGYGFLSENAEFAQACGEAGLKFIGPSPEAMRAMGSKTESRRIAAEAGAPVVPGSLEPLDSDETAAARADEIGYPVMVKASAGGGGKGMRLVREPGGLASALRAARSEAASSFGDPAVYLEKALVRPRHIEIQVLGDEEGRLIWLGERECSLQRRHQKVVEEAPSPAVDPELRARLGETAVAVAREAGYTNAGTVEFLMTPEGDFYFLEMNARLQVEHPVTEMVTGRDLVKDQIAVAQGEPLPLTQEEVEIRGHSVECRIYAEDPDTGFLPSPGTVRLLRLPQGPGVRNDVGIHEGGEVSIHYDPMLAKLVVWGADRGEAVRRMGRALGEFHVLGVRSTVPFLRRIMEDRAFRDGDMDTTTLDEMLEREVPPPGEDQVTAAVLAAVLERRRRRTATRPPGERRGSAWRAASRRGSRRGS